MNARVHLKTDFGISNDFFMKFDGDMINLKFDRKEVGYVINLIDKLKIYSDDSTLEILILKEIRQIFNKKYNIIVHRATVSLTLSQAFTLFSWLNVFEFDHPLENSFAREIVTSIHKQIV